MKSTLVSICIPTYEPQAAHLRDAIESVLAQTEERWTLRIRDDASHTDVAALVQPYLTDARITFVRGEERLGIGGNWNACVREATAPFLQFLFQDDLWDEGYLESALNPLQQDARLGFVSVEHGYVFEGAIDPAFQKGYDALLAIKRTEVTAGHHNGRSFLQWWMQRGLRPNVIGEPSFVMIRRTAMEAAGPFLEDMPQFLDAEAWTRLLQISDWFSVNTSHGSFRVHPLGASTRNQADGIGLFDRLRCMESVMNASQGSSRHAAKRAIACQLAGMIRKFRHRQHTGQSITLQGSGAIKTFILRHPLLMVRAVMMVLLETL